MKIVFDKGPAKHDLMEVFRRSGAPQRVECPKQGIIPLDMVHLAVESTLQARGFLDRVRDGEAAGFRMAVEADSDTGQRLVKVIQAGGGCRARLHGRVVCALGGPADGWAAGVVAVAPAWPSSRAPPSRGRSVRPHPGNPPNKSNHQE